MSVYIIEGGEGRISFLPIMRVKTKTIIKDKLAAEKCNTCF